MVSRDESGQTVPLGRCISGQEGTVILLRSLLSVLTISQNNPEYNKDEYRPLAELIASIGANAGLVPLSERPEPEELVLSTQRLIDQVDELKARIAIPPTSKAGISLSAGNIQVRSTLARFECGV